MLLIIFESILKKPFHVNVDACLQKIQFSADIIFALQVS